MLDEYMKEHPEIKIKRGGMTFHEYMAEFHPGVRLRHSVDVYFTIFKRASATSLKELGFSARLFYNEYMTHLLTTRLRKVS